MVDGAAGGTRITTSTATVSNCVYATPKNWIRSRFKLIFPLDMQKR